MVAAFPAGGPSIRLTPYGLTLPVPEVPAASEETTISPQEPAIPAPLSVVDLFKVGIGPSSSHTVGPMRAGHAFARELAALLATAATTPSSPATTSKLTHLTVDLFGSLGATGRGHNTDRAVLLGLAGHLPESIEIHEVEALLPELARTSHLPVAGVGSVPFTLADDLRFLPGTVLPFHVNGLTITAWGTFDATSDAGGSGDASTTKAPAKGASPAPLLQRTYYSVGGGFVMVETSDSPHNPAPVPLDDSGAGNSTTANATATPAPLPYPFATGAGLLAHCSATGLSVAQVVRANEESQRSRADLEEHLDTIANTMFACVHAGIHTRGILPGGLDVPRRAAALADKLRQRAAASPPAHGAAANVPNATPIEWAATSVDPMRAMDLVNLHALAVNEENAAGHRVVTAPTNGAAGVIPAVLGYLTLFCPEGGANLGDNSGG
ncbi:MAG: serine dehydratase beta chain, partial [Actinomycetaceae bacterium]|nr:serine dehydratase beta chain [Actinomycetaceae bacterium]